MKDTHYQNRYLKTCNQQVSVITKGKIGGKMDKLMKKFFRSSIISSMVLIILGVLIFFQSEFTIISISYILGGILIGLGVLAIIKFIRNTNSIMKNELDIVYGVVTMILGLLIIKNPKAIASVIPIILGIGIILNSATKLQYSFELKTEENDQWKTAMIISIISIICGVILLFNPFKGAVIITQIIGIFIIIYAVLDVISTFIIKRNVDSIHSAISGDTTEAEVIEESKAKKTTRKKKNSK